jgi:hypothetical protein
MSLAALFMALLLWVGPQAAEAGRWVPPKVSAPDPATQRWSFREKDVLERAEDIRICEAVEAQARAEGLVRAGARAGSVMRACLMALGYRWEE